MSVISVILPGIWGPGLSISSQLAYLYTSKLVLHSKGLSISLAPMCSYSDKWLEIPLGEELGDMLLYFVKINKRKPQLNLELGRSVERALMPHH